MSELFLNLLDMSLAATWLIAAVILVRLLLKKAPRWITCLLWVLVAVRLVCPFSLESKLSLVPETDPVLPSIAEAYVPDTPIQVPAVSPEQTRPADTVQNSAIIVETPTVETVNYLEVAALIWLVGMATLLLYALISYLRLRRRVAASILMQESIRLCDGIDSPFILGLFRPRIYLPSTVTQEDMAYVLAHERAHLARHDHWWKPLGFVLLAVYWFNPLVWAAYILLCRDIELACDEKVICEMGDGEKKAYSEALLSCSVPRRMIAACPLAFGEVGVKSRIKSVLNYKKPAFWIIVVALVACVVLAVCFLTDPVKPTVYDVEKQNGFGITAIEENVGMRVNIPTDVLNENIYSHEPYVYEEGEVVLWQTDTTTLWLESAGWCNGEEKDIVFDCQFSYTIPDQGTIRVIGRPNIQDGVTVSSMLGEGVRSKDASDSRTTYPDTVWFRGSNWGIQLCVAVDADVVRSASDYISFVVGGLTDITYEKGPANHEKDIAVILGTTVRAVEEFDYYRNPNNMPGIGHGSIVGGNMGYEIEYETGTHSLEQGTCKLSVIKNGETKIISQGKLLWNLYCADLNGDEIRELCATVGDCTDRSDTAVIVYDPISEKTYRLNAPDGSYALSAYEAGKDKILQIERTYTDSGARYVGDLRFDENGTLRMSNIQPYDISAVGGADKPENIAVTPEDTSIGDAMKAAVEKLIDGKLPVTIGKLDPEGRIHPVIGHLNAWDCANAAGYGRGILSHTYQEVDVLETSEALITLEFAVDGTEWGIIFYDGTDSVSVFKEGTEYLLQAIPDYEDIFLSPLGTLMRRWYDEAEYLFQCERVEVIPNTGQSYLEAAQEFCEAYEGVHLSVSSGSHYRYNEIFCRVEAAESATELFREKGEIGDNTYAFFAYTAFLPESERARNQSIAGNTALYEGNEPNVPEGALEYMRCGYITLKDDGWHGIIVGSGF